MHNITSKIVVEDLQSSGLQELTSSEAEEIFGGGIWYDMGHAVGKFIHDLRNEDLSDLGDITPIG